MSVPSYVLNFDELADAIRNYLETGINVDVNNISFSTENIENILREIETKIQGVDYNNLISALNALGVKIDALSGNLGVSGTQKIYGQMLQIPASSGSYEVDFIAPSNGKITSITTSQSAWNFQDTWDLQVNGITLFNSVRTKEYGESKYFEVFYPITGGQNIKFIFNNNSGSNKTIWVDFALLEG